jgi:hypothetical protein
MPNKKSIPCLLGGRPENGYRGVPDCSLKDDKGKEKRTLKGFGGKHINMSKPGGETLHLQSCWARSGTSTELKWLGGTQGYSNQSSLALKVDEANAAGVRSCCSCQSYRSEDCQCGEQNDLNLFDVVEAEAVGDHGLDIDQAFLKQLDGGGILQRTGFLDADSAYAWRGIISSSENSTRRNLPIFVAYGTNGAATPQAEHIS